MCTHFVTAHKSRCPMRAAEAADKSRRGGNGQGTEARTHSCCRVP